MAICSKYKIAYFLLAPLQGFSGGKGYSLEGPGSGPGLLSKLSCGWERGFFFKLSFTSVWKQIKDFCLINSFLFFSLLWVFIPFLAAPIGWFNGTKGLSSITVQRKKHSLTGTGKAICNHNSSYLLIFYLKQVMSIALYPASNHGVKYILKPKQTSYVLANQTGDTEISCWEAQDACKN